jgi:hypothetical protein
VSHNIARRFLRSAGALAPLLVLALALLGLACASGCSFFSEEPTMAVTPAALDFGTELSEMQLAIQVTGDTTGDMHWRLGGLPLWARATPTEGSASTLVTIEVTRSGCGCATGERNGTLRVEGPDGTQTVNLHMVAPES